MVSAVSSVVSTGLVQRLRKRAVKRCALCRKQVFVDRLAEQCVAHPVVATPTITDDHMMIHALSQCRLEVTTRQSGGNRQQRVGDRAASGCRDAKKPTGIISECL